MGACQLRSWSRCEALLMGLVEEYEGTAFVVRLYAAAWANDVAALQQLWGNRPYVHGIRVIMGSVLNSASDGGSAEAFEWANARMGEMAWRQSGRVFGRSRALGPM